jgi:surface protein
MRRFVGAGLVAVMMLVAFGFGCDMFGADGGTYTVTYDGNGSTGGSPPVDDNEYLPGDEITVLGNTGDLRAGGRRFEGWATTQAGGELYQQGDTLIMGDSDLVLYAIWEPVFVTTWRTNNPGASDAIQITLPLVATGTYDFTVDWGDGTENAITEWDALESTHTYAVFGTYTVTITGTIAGWAFDNGPFPYDTPSDARKLLEVSSWGQLALGYTTGQFAGAEYLQVTAPDAPDLSQTTSLDGCFYGATGFTGDLSSWDLAGITSVRYMFSGAEAFDCDMSTWNTSTVTDMNGMFLDAHSFSADLGSWNTSSVTDMAGMFSGTDAFNRDLSQWDTANVTRMDGMFSDTASFNQDLSDWNTAKVTDMSFMFSDATVFNGDLSNWETSSVEDMGSMFERALVFNGDISDWDTSAVLNMRSMFDGAAAFDGGIGDWDTSAVEDMEAMFRSAAAFDVNIGTWNVAQVVSMQSMFEDAASFNADLSGWSFIEIDTMERMFYDATSFDNGGNPSGLNDWDAQWPSQPTVTDMFEGSAMEGQEPAWY